MSKKYRKKPFGIKDLNMSFSGGSVADAENSVWGSGRNKWKRFPKNIGENEENTDYFQKQERRGSEKKPIHIVNESYSHYKKRMTSGDFLKWIFGGALLSSIGLILFSIGGAGIGDKAIFVLIILLGLWIMWKGFKKGIRRK